MKNKTKGTIAGVAAIALLASGTTFALWNDSVNVDGGVITAGNLDVAIVEPAKDDSVWKDISIDRTDKDHKIVNLDDFRIVPGDTIQGTFGIDAALQGENLVANLGLSLAGAPVGELLSADKGVSITYTLLDNAGKPVQGAENIVAGTTSTVKFAASDNAQKGTLLTLGPALDGVADYKVVVTAHFVNYGVTQKQDKVTKSVLLKDLGVTLEQTRAVGDGGFSAPATTVVP